MFSALRKAVFLDRNLSLATKKKFVQSLCPPSAFLSLASPTLFLLLLLYVGEGKGSGEANVYYLCNRTRVTV